MSLARDATMYESSFPFVIVGLDPIRSYPTTLG